MSIEPIKTGGEKWAFSLYTRGRWQSNSSLSHFLLIGHFAGCGYNDTVDRYKNLSERLPKKVEVNAYSGYKANERPLSFAIEGERLDVREIIDRWYGMENDYFKILASDGRIYILKWQRLLDVWLLVKVQEPGSKMQGTR